MSHFIATCGPTGIGKTYQMQRLMSLHPENFTTVLSVTTRARRGPEDDAWYRFVSLDELSKLDATDVIFRMTFRGEQYLLLRSEIERALARAPAAFMAIVTPAIHILRERSIRHELLRCRVADVEGYRARLQRRGYEGETLEREVATGVGFEYPSDDPLWLVEDVLLGSDQEDSHRFEEALCSLVPELSSLLRA